MRHLFIFFSFFLTGSSFAGIVKFTPLITAGIDSPTTIVSDPLNNNRFYVLEQKGRIVVVENGQLLQTAFLDIEEKVTSGGEMGLLGLAFHPGFRSNGRFFVNYTTENPSRHSVIAEFKTGSRVEKEILTYAQPYTNHKGGQLAFDKKGYLYIGVGDGGSAGDPHGNGQNKKALLGKILRIDINNGSPYAIPTDNPFQEAGVRNEIYSYGMRNPWRFSFDRLTGALFAADVGQDKWEEIDVIEKGGNYGWNTMEGTHCFKPAQNCDQTGLILPIWEYSHSKGNSITGGYVYRGTKIPALQGVYVYADYGSGTVWGLTYDQATKKVIKNEVLINSHLPISSFSEDNDGEILAASYTGAIYRLVSN